MFNLGPSQGMLQQLLARRQGGGMLPPGMGGEGGLTPGIPINPGGGGMEYTPGPGTFPGGSGMPTIDVGMGAKFPGMPPPSMGEPRMPQITEGPVPTFPGSPNMGGSRPPMQGGPMQGGMGRMMGGMRDKMSTNRPGFWGKYNSIAQAAQGPAMNMLMGGNRRRQQPGY